MARELSNGMCEPCQRPATGRITSLHIADLRSPRVAAQRRTTALETSTTVKPCKEWNSSFLLIALEICSFLIIAANRRTGQDSVRSIELS
jgi:hypothetical protein